MLLSAVCLLFNDTMDQQSWMEMPTNGQSLLWHMSIHQNYNLPPSCPNDAFMSFCTSNEDEHLTNIYFSKLRSQRHLFWQLKLIPSTATAITSPVGHNSMCYTRRRNSSSQRKGAPISCCCVVQYNIQLESSAGAAIAAALRCSQRRLRSLQSSPCFYCHYIVATAASSKESMLAFKVVPLQLLDKQKKNVNCHFAAKFDSIRGNTHTITCHSWGLQQLAALWCKLLKCSQSKFRNFHH